MDKTEPSSLLRSLSAKEQPPQAPVECLGRTFASEDARRAYFLERLKEKLPELREREDFPIGDDEDILRLSDPPYYTACPNPFLADFVAHHGRPYDPDEPYHREPFAVDVSEGKNDPLYKAHGYHTKVPHRAIVPSILHYTKPGDIVLDGFCGSGMTGVAAQWCGTAPEEYRLEIESRWKAEGREPPEWGARRAILGDLSPAATFIAANYNIPFDVAAFSEAATKLLKDVEEEVGWMYETLHTDGKTTGKIEYVVWSQVFTCPHCSHQFEFFEHAIDHATNRIQAAFPCPNCTVNLTKHTLQAVFETGFESRTSTTWQRIRLAPSIIAYRVGSVRHQKAPDPADFSLLEKIAELPIPTRVPVTDMPTGTMYHGSRIAPKGLTNIHRFYLPRPMHVLSSLWNAAESRGSDRLAHMLAYFVEQAVIGMSLLNRHHVVGRANVNQQLTGVYYVPSVNEETAYWRILEGKLKRLVRAFDGFPIAPAHAFVGTASTAQLAIPDETVDYIFTDPPFGENIHYADLNLLPESWHRILTRVTSEAIVDSKKGKDINAYKSMMQDCFTEYCRVLKPGRWMTVVFHNSKNAVWNAIQEAMLGAGFVVADVRTLDKKQGSYRQVTSTAVKQDLVISAYKPNGGLETRFDLHAGAEAGVWDFVRTHLRQLPVFVAKEDRAEIVAERQAYMLFDRTVAFHVQRGIAVPLSLAEFHEGIAQRFPERDGMFFLQEQVIEYDRRRMTVQDVLQLELFVKDEESAIQWLRQQLARKPRSFQDIHPDFIRELAGWQKHERMLELSDLLAQNFLHYDGAGQVPAQIHSYLSTNFKELRCLPKDAPALQAKAKGRWYVPDPNKAGDLETIRERSLLREFDEYAATTTRRLRQFRLEAIRAGFRRAWQNRDYATVVAVADKIPQSVLQEDPKLLMWYDQAAIRIAAE